MIDNMRMWEIVKGMNEGLYKEGRIFKSEEFGDMIITEDGELCWLSWDVVAMLVDDKSEWEAI
jgi:hypothetical protein